MKTNFFFNIQVEAIMKYTIDSFYAASIEANSLPEDDVVFIEALKGILQDYSLLRLYWENEKR